ncbi:hypothetical protein CDCA_CDCA06G1982 [Cyanidium caldarium]|uniref:MobA-like NTP transferase domain-containing protein n=1 Tax=Cyanidium caldarium TaxID=2771 RepID=A0AAV9IUM6_CYACA|nr:hypothetical protein CDCA_CDCA06G1982 [Cyanidium caldarium]
MNADLTQVPLHQFVQTPARAENRTSLAIDAADSDAVCGIVLAAGRGSRFGDTATPKVLHQLRGKPLVQYPLEALQGARVPAVLVVGWQWERVVQTLSPHAYPYVHQEQPVRVVGRKR